MTARVVPICAVLLGSVLASGCTVCCPPVTRSSGTAANEVIQEFSGAGGSETAWRVFWATGPGKGLYITGAWFRSRPGAPWMKVLHDARLAEIFVPYHPGSPRYYDLTSFSFDLVQATRADAGCCGTLLGSPPVVVKEVRDRGVLWKDDRAGRRGRELVLWATLDAANYNYIMQYGFRDDGTVTFRVAGTARNLPGMETVSHVHNGIWRVDVDLNGSLHDSATLMRHEGSIASTLASDVHVPFNGGVEGSADFVAEQFTMVHIEDTQTRNEREHLIGYDAMPLREGNARHPEEFSHHDFWVTRYVGTELIASQLPAYVGNNQPVIDTDVVLWHITPMHHHPRDEDGRYVDGRWEGVALAMYGGFDLRPRNLFSETPLHP